MPNAPSGGRPIRPWPRLPTISPAPTFNTAIASVMELLNIVAKHTQRSASDRRVIQEALDIAVLALSPIVPHVTHALWRELGHTTALIDEPWMMVDAAALETSTIELVVQVKRQAARPHLRCGRRGRRRRARSGARGPQCAEIRRGRGGPQGHRRARQAGHVVV